MNSINEWYFPDNFDSLPDTITLYHGTDYYNLTDIIESGVIDARNGKSTGETKGMNWFFTKYRDNFSRGFMFSIDVKKSEINKTTNGLKYMNDNEIANYEAIDIKNHNFKIVEAFNYDLEMLQNIWRRSQEKNPDDEFEAMLCFAEFLNKKADYDITIDDVIFQQIISQFIGRDKLYQYGIIESKLTETPDYIDITNAYDNNNGHYQWDDKCSISFIVDSDIKEAYVSEWSHMDIIYNDIYDGDEDKVDNDMDPKWLRRNSFHGRIWTTPKAISFWKQPTPQQLVQIIKLLEEKYSLFEILDLMNYSIEISKNNFIPVKEYINQEQNDNNGFDMATLHLMKGDKKSNTPQMQGYIKNRTNNLGNKLGVPNNSKEISQAEYNFYKKYGMGESININEVNANEISLKSFDVRDELHPRFWVNNKLNSRVRLRLLDIADDFIDTLAVNWVKPKDIIFTGSLANYNWSHYSDIDVHVIIDYDKVYKKKEFVEDYFKAKKELWLNEHPSLKIYGFPIEFYVEDVDANNTSNGIYSLNKNKWIKEPVDFQDVKLNEKYIKKQAAKIMTDIDNIEKKIKSATNDTKIEKYNEKLQSIFDKIKKMRVESLKKSGEMSSGNIIFKILRRSKYIDKIWDTINTSYDKINSIENK